MESLPAPRGALHRPQEELLLSADLARSCLVPRLAAG